MVESSSPASAVPPKQRTLWIDHAKGITIVLVVAHHVLEGLNNTFTLPEVMYWYAISGPVRMPLFFLIAGLFAAKAIQSDIRDFIDRKVFHFLYLYVLWSFIIYILRLAMDPFTNTSVRAEDILYIFWDPVPTIWFLYALLLSFVIARLSRSVSPIYVVAFASLLHAFALTTSAFAEVPILQRLSELLVYFLIGVYASPWIRENAPRLTWLHTGLFVAAFLAVGLTARHYDLIHEPLVFFSLSALSAGALIGLSVNLVSIGWGALFTRIGENSLYIYLVHFIPAAGVRIVMMRAGISDPLTIFVVAVVVSVILGIAFRYATRGNVLRILTQPPRLFQRDGKLAPAQQSPL